MDLYVRSRNSADACDSAVMERRQQVLVRVVGWHEVGDVPDAQAPTWDWPPLGRLLREVELSMSLCLTKFPCEKLFACLSSCVTSRRLRACCAITRRAVPWEATDCHYGSLYGSGSGTATIPTIGFDKKHSVQGVLSLRAAGVSHST